MKFLLTLAVAYAGSVVAFAPVHLSQHQQQTLRGTSSLAAAPSPTDVARKFCASFIATSTILSNVAILAPPQEAFAFDAGSSQVIAARSGGRAGGRAPARSAAPSRTRVIERQTTVIQQQPMYASPGGMMMAPPMYAPQPSGLGLAIGLNAVSGISSGFREARQENEIRSTRDQLTEARIKEAEMEARLRQLEMNR